MWVFETTHHYEMLLPEQLMQYWHCAPVTVQLQQMNCVFQEVCVQEEWVHS